MRDSNCAQMQRIPPILMFLDEIMKMGSNGLSFFERQESDAQVQRFK